MGAVLINCFRFVPFCHSSLLLQADAANSPTQKMTSNGERIQHGGNQRVNSSSPRCTQNGRPAASGNDDAGAVEPIAVIGMSCRLPGTAADVPGFWDMLVTGRTAWTDGPGKRFNMKAFQGSREGPRGTVSCSVNRQDTITYELA